MIRKAFVLEVHPDKHDEYRQRHNPIWPELASTIKAHGVRSYSIFLHAETNQLFGYMEIDDEEKWQALGATEVMQRWRKHMSDVTLANPDNTPKRKNLVEVFHLD
jgi:L-rhamnose mutarotase